MKKLLFLFLLLFISIKSFSYCVIFCEARYQYQIYHEAVPNANFEGPLGTIPISGSGKDAYYETVWSNMYTLNIQFYSGDEINENIGSNNYNPNSIIAIVEWSNGGYSIITINRWSTKLKSITKQEVLYNNSTGEKISELSGYDYENRFWEIYPQE